MTVLPGTAEVTLGVKRSGIEFRQSLIYLPDLFQLLCFPAVMIAVLFLMRGRHVPGTTFSLETS